MNKLRWALLGIVGIFSIAGGFMTTVEEAHGWWSAIPGFFALFGFFGCLLIIIFSKFLGRILLYKREDYYDGN
ncbi:MAG: hypothetical protein A3J94_11400 [Syntrophus sp. RIFOXYC2_FULL_54_9]|nr:MAG: hypothetical protein A3J94_11400 [Syntrophus sp. RIFOXYC2_FULL_54_9]